MDVPTETSHLKKAIRKSQHCQRNWDLDSKISEEDIELLKISVTECPSKQNIAYYGVHFIFDRETIEKIHEATDGFVYNYEPRQSVTNSQVLANLLVVFEALNIHSVAKQEPWRNEDTVNFELNNNEVDALLTDQKIAVGVAAGYLNLTSNLLGFSTGCCSCFEEDKVKNILGLENSPMLLMGVGLSDKSVGRRLHHKDRSFLFPTFTKQQIPFNQID